MKVIVLDPAVPSRLISSVPPDRVTLPTRPPASTLTLLCPATVTPEFVPPFRISSTEKVYVPDAPEFVPARYRMPGVLNGTTSG